MKEYFPINKHVLLNDVEELSFDLYFKKTGENISDDYALLYSKNSMFDNNIKDKLKKHQRSTIYILSNQQVNYNKFIFDTIKISNRDTNLPIKEKVNNTYNCALSAISDIIKDPRSGKSINNSQKIVDEIMYLLDFEEIAFSSFINLRKFDYYTWTHSINVSFFSLALAKKHPEVDRKDYPHIGIGGLLHDIGKTMVSQEILNKPGKLTNEEFAQIKKHPVLGYELLLEKHSFLSDVTINIVRHHHERNNGTGYPDGLSFNDIPPTTRIVHLVDIYDALTTNRVYSRAKTPYQALKIMKEEMKMGCSLKKELNYLISLIGYGK